MAYIGKKPSFSQVRTAELVVQRGTDISTAGTIAALDVSNISLVRLTAATVLQGIAAPSAPADNGKRVTLINANTSDLIVRNESGSATAANRVSTGISRDMRITPGASLTLTYNTASSRWSVESSSAEINIDRLKVASEVVTSGPDISVLSTGNGKSTLLELSTGFGTSVRSLAAGLSGQFVVLVNKTGSLIQVANEDTGATAADRILTGTGGPISLQNNASLFLAYLTDSTSASRWQVVGGTGSGGGATEQVTQTGIGNLANFPVGTPLYVDATTGWTAANASAANTAEVAGMLGRSLGANLAEVVMAGEVAGVTASVFTEAVLPARGEAVFLSTTSGKLTVTEPSVVGQVSKPLGIVHNVNGSTSVDIMFYNMRGSVVGGANARTTISVANSAATSVVDVTNYNSLKLEGELNVNRSSGGNQRAYYTVEAAKNGAGTWQVSAGYTGDDILYTTLPTWDVSGTQLQVTMPTVTNFNSASLTYSLNAPAVGASLPLSIDSTALNIVDSAPLSYRNRIINGDMRIDQRNAGAKITASVYGMDRFAINQTVTGKLGLQQVADGPAGFSYCAAVTVEASYSVTASDFYGLVQAVEGFNMADFAWGTADAKAVTISFWTKASTTGTYGGAVFNDSGTRRTYAFTYIVNSANTWEQKTVTIPGCTDGTWNTTNGAGLYLNFALGVGSNNQTTAGSWNAGAFRGPSGVVQLVGLANGQSLRITGVQLEVGSKATAFERRPYGMELQMCQRYYQRITGNGINSEIPVFYNSTNNTVFLSIPLMGSMRPSSNAVSTNLLDSQYTGSSAPTAGTQWTFMSSGSAYLVKTGTISIVAIPSGTAPTHGSMTFRFTGATYASSLNAIVMMPAVYFEANAEL